MGLDLELRHLPLELGRELVDDPAVEMTSPDKAPTAGRRRLAPRPARRYGRP